MKKRFVLIVFAFFCVSILSGCSHATSEAVLAPEPSSTTAASAMQTPTPLPVQVPVVNPTAAPTAIPTTSPSVTSSAESDAQAAQGMTSEMLQNPALEGRIQDLGEGYISVASDSTIGGNDGYEIVIEGSPDNAVIVNYNSDTMIWSTTLTQGQSASFVSTSAEDFSVGQRVAIFGSETGDDFAATQIVLMNFAS